MTKQPKRRVERRNTPIRSALIKLFRERCGPLSILEIKKKIKSAGLSPDKSTLYRETGFLTDEKIIRELTLGGKKKFESAATHHHHLICLKCFKTIPVNPTVNLNQEGIRLARSNGFNVLRHELEFYGFCRKCK